MDWLLLCYNCGLPLNDAVMAGNGDYLCCSGSKNVPSCASSGMVCPLNEIPLIHFEDIKKHFDPGSYKKKNICNQDAITVTEQADYSGMHFNQFKGKRTSCFKKHRVEKEMEFRCPAVDGIGNTQLNEGATGQTIALGKFKSEDPNPLQGSISDVNDFLQACCASSEKSEEYEVGPVHEDFSGAQSPCSSSESEEGELAAQGDVNNIPLSDRVTDMVVKLIWHATGVESLTAEEVSTLQSAFGRLVSVSSSGPDDNRNGLSKKDIAAGISFNSDIGGKFGYSASDTTHNEKVERRFANIETKLAHFESLHEEDVRSRQICAEEIKADYCKNRNTVQHLKDDVAKLQSDLGEMKSLFQQQFNEIIHVLNMHEEPIRRIRNTEGYVEESIQTLKRRLQSLEGMVDRLTEKITKLHLVCEVCGAPNVQGPL